MAEPKVTTTREWQAYCVFSWHANGVADETSTDPVYAYADDAGKEKALLEQCRSTYGSSHPLGVWFVKPADHK